MFYGEQVGKFKVLLAIVDDKKFITITGTLPCRKFFKAST